MKYHVVYAADGTIVALSPVESKDSQGLQGGPVAEDNHHIAVLELPDTPTMADLVTLVKSVRVEIQATGPRLIQK